MNKDDLKRYSVIVRGGSGCLFQPMVKSYTYILTAKHLFKDKKQDSQGKDYDEVLPNGSIIDIKQFISTSTGWNEEPIHFTLIEGETYFPHKDADIVILKIEPAIEGFNKICRYDSFENEHDFLLCGCPENYRENEIGERYTNYKIERFVASGNNKHIAQLDSVLNQINIYGASGGGILKMDNDHILIAGIQSEMANGTDYQAGQIAFVPIHFFEEIIGYSENQSKLSPLLPFFIKSFKFLGDDIFILQECILTKNKAAKLKEALKTKALAVMSSELTPYAIKEHLTEKLNSISKQPIYEHSSRKFWSLWLELLTIISIAEVSLEEDCEVFSLSREVIPNILAKFRLFYSNTNKDYWVENIDKLHQMDYNGLATEGIVVVASNVKAEGMHILNPELIIGDISRVENEFEKDKVSGKIDSATDFPLRKYKFVNISAFKEGTVEKLDDNMVDELITNFISKLKGIYGEIISNGKHN